MVPVLETLRQRGKSPVVGPPTVSVPSNVIGIPEQHLSDYVATVSTAWLFAGEGDVPAYPRSLSRVWSMARQEIGRPDLHFHDLRLSGLTWAAATGASTAELMLRAGHKSPAAALRYQHATEDRDRVLA